MLHVWRISYKIRMTSFLLYQLCQAILFLLQFGMRLSSSAADSSAIFVYLIMYLLLWFNSTRHEKKNNYCRIHHLWIRQSVLNVDNVIVIAVTKTYLYCFITTLRWLLHIDAIHQASVRELMKYITFQGSSIVTGISSIGEHTTTAIPSTPSAMHTTGATGEVTSAGKHGRLDTLYIYRNTLEIRHNQFR